MFFFIFFRYTVDIRFSVLFYMKRHSWSTILFLKMNALQGVSRPLDVGMFLCANYLIYVLGAIVGFYALLTWVPADLHTFESFLLFIAVSLAFSLGPSWWIGWMWPHRRPIVEHPAIKQMFRPMSTWKSFPSDHTIASFVLAESAVIFSTPFWVSMLGIGMACMIGVSRVYAGVHYPRDILGGVLFASGACLLAFILLF